MDAHLFEFVVPMVPPSWNEAARVEEHAKRLEASSSPTAVAVSTLDDCAPAVDDGTDHCAHWGLTHFLLDGHHKLQAAAESGRPLRLLSLLSIDASLATAEEGRARARAPLAHTGRPRTSSSHDLSRAVRRPIHNRSSTRRCAMPGDDAARELARLLRGPVLLARWPDGMTTDDVLGALSELGRLALVAPSEELERYRCSLVLHDGAGRCSGSGLSLTAAAVRCLLEAEEGIAALAADGIAELQRSLAHGEPDVTS